MVICIPKGNLEFSVIPEGIVIDGAPINVQGALKDGSPVFSNPFNAGVGADGVGKTNNVGLI